MQVLDAAARWQCTPSEVLKYGDVMYLANRWGVSPEKVLEEDDIWRKMQLYVDDMRLKVTKNGR